jgi:hypothetical protein
MLEKLFHIRLQIHYTNSKSYNAGCEDAYVVAENEDMAFENSERYFNWKFKETCANKRVASLVFCSELKKFIPAIGEQLTREVIFEKTNPYSDIN